MFKAPFSFNGRIRRTEYGISFIVYVLAIIVLNLTPISFINSYSRSYSSDGTTGDPLYFIIMAPFVWFIWAQGAKRCHDVGHSGWWQLIPFYFIWLLFSDGQHGSNEYGNNPKGIGNDTQFTFEQQHHAGGEER